MPPPRDTINSGSLCDRMAGSAFVVEQALAAVGLRTGEQAVLCQRKARASERCDPTCNQHTQHGLHPSELKVGEQTARSQGPL